MEEPAVNWSIPLLFPNNSTTPVFNTTDYHDILLERQKEIYGPKRDSLAIVIPVTIMYTLIFISGVIGNISTCIVIKNNRSMHTATNYYLFSLAISDFFLLLSGVPQEMYTIWSKWPYVFGEVFCIVRGLLAETAANATVLTITAFSVERYFAICHPFLAHALSKLSRATKIILLIWFFSFLAALPQAAQFGVVTVMEVERCDVVRVIIDHSFELATFLFFITPMSIILVLYLLIGLKLHQTNLMRSTTANGNILYCPSATGQHNSSLRSKTQQGTKRVLKMLVAVVIAFFLCWAPFHAQRLVYIYSIDKIHSNPVMVSVYHIMTYISGVLYYLSTCINPLLYNIMSNKFREAFKATFHQFNVFSQKTNKPVQEYNFMSRSKRMRITFQEFDYTSSSQREESYQSTASWKYIDSMNTNSSICSRSSFTSSQRRNQYRNNNNNYQSNSSDIVKIDEVDLPSKDASLNVFCNKQGDIEIKVLKRKRSGERNRRRRHGARFNPIRKMFTAFKARKTDFGRTGFYTPPLDDNFSLSSYCISSQMTSSRNKSVRIQSPTTSRQYNY